MELPARAPVDSTCNSPSGTLKIRRDIALLFATRFVRMFAYGLVSIVLVLYLTRLGFDAKAVGLLLSLTLTGDLAISLWMTTRADRLGRRRMLAAGAVLMFLAGVVFVSTSLFPLLLAAAIVGVISPSGSEVGPFLPIEQAAISEEVEPGRRTHLFAWYNLSGSIAAALGALTAGWVIRWNVQAGGSDLTAYRTILSGYALLGLLLGVGFALVSSRVEATPVEVSQQRRLLGLHRSRGIVFRLSTLFALDAFAGGFVLQTFVAYWFTVRFNIGAGRLGTIFFTANLLSGLSGLVAARLADRFGLINTMVFTHIPSNVLLILIPLMPTAGLAITVLFLRFAISQMDVPTRQSLVASVVAPDERAAAGGVTNVFRSSGTMLAPILAGIMFGSPRTLSWPFFFAGGLKICYDLTLLALFRKLGRRE
jgi:MFS family permease